MTQKRPFKHRHTDSDTRSRIRQEARSVRNNRYSKLRKRYATLLLGASMALGGIGIPLKAVKDAPPPKATSNVFGEVSHGLEGVAAGVTEVAEDVTASPAELINPAQAAEQIAVLTEEAREEFFRSEVPFGSIIWDEARKNSVDPELMAAMVQQESRFKPRARSPVGAMGLMQLMPRTGAWMGATNLYDPVDNVKAGAKYIKYLNKRFNGDETLVVAAYNGGEGNVKKYGGVPPFRETRNYVQKVSKYKEQFENQVAEAAANHIAEQNPVLAEMAR